MWLGFLFLVIGLIWFLGPRVTVDETIQPLQLPKNLDQYLDQSESSFNNIREGLNKEILWNDPEKKQQTELSVVYLHGFSASRLEISPVPENMSLALGANLFMTRLSGHGRTGKDLGESSANEWLQDALEALEIGKRIGKRVVLMGTSTGGTLVLWLALKYTISIAASFAKQLTRYGCLLNLEG